MDGVRQPAGLLGRVGVWSWQLVEAPLAETRAAVERIEELGYGALWYPEGHWVRETIAAAGLLLAWSERLAVCSGIAQIWARDGAAAASAARTLHDAYDGRFTLGIGVSHAHAQTMRGHNYEKPLSAMRAYLDSMDENDEQSGCPRGRRLVAALAPRMLELTRERADGTLTYFVPVAHTAFAREQLGPDKLIAVEQTVVLDPDASTARATAREFCERHLQAPNYRNNLLRLGHSEQELEGLSDAVVDALVAHGDVEAIRQRVQDHLHAGADHVCIQVVGGADGFQLDALERLAPAVLEL